MTDTQKILSFFIPLFVALGLWCYISPRPDIVQCFWLIGCFGLWGLAYNVYVRWRRRHASFMVWGFAYGLVIGVIGRAMYLAWLLG